MAYILGRVAGNHLPLAAGNLSPCSARQCLLSLTYVAAACAAGRWVPTNMSFLCGNRTHLRILTSTSDIQPAICCTGPSIICIPHYVLDRNCALGVLRCSRSIHNPNRVGAVGSFTFWRLSIHPDYYCMGVLRPIEELHPELPAESAISVNWLINAANESNVRLCTGSPLGGSYWPAQH